jgi:flagella basal body P-ring formation protein FlgA
MSVARAHGPGTMRLLSRVASSACAALLLALLPVSAALAREVVLPVPRMVIYPGNVITDDMLTERVFRGAEFEGPGVIAAREALVGQVARTTLLPNQPVTPSGVRSPFAVQQGQPAVVVFQSGGLVISGTAVALQAGSVGDVIGLRNTDSGTTIRGKVQPDGSVRVGMP